MPSETMCYTLLTCGTDTITILYDYIIERKKKGNSFRQKYGGSLSCLEQKCITVRLYGIATFIRARYW